MSRSSLETNSGGDLKGMEENKNDKKKEEFLEIHSFLFLKMGKL